MLACQVAVVLPCATCYTFICLGSTGYKYYTTIVLARNEGLSKILKETDIAPKISMVCSFSPISHIIVSLLVQSLTTDTNISC
jgi:hypothetical protein